MRGKSPGLGVRTRDSGSNKCVTLVKFIPPRRLPFLYLTRVSPLQRTSFAEKEAGRTEGSLSDGRQGPTGSGNLGLSFREPLLLSLTLLLYSSYSLLCSLISLPCFRPNHACPKQGPTRPPPLKHAIPTRSGSSCQVPRRENAIGLR